MEILLEHLGKGFITMLIVSMPCVLTAAGIGLVVGILQAVTQVQEQTIAAAPKIVAVFLVIMMGGGMFVDIIKNYFLESANLAFNIVTKEDDYVLPPGGYAAVSQGMFENEKADMKMNQPHVKEIMNSPGKVPFADKKDKTTFGKGSPNGASAPNIVESKKIYGR